ncbi:MAG: L-asparaginase 1 [Neptuniibacter caesariensis]|uniref:L-asparaginase 1 n=1 Tax=Neptuniibacter caesariensis TaxID=207954 RepID=A0A2G6JJN1_NEPCE|nr:MAG: L-asparaginase 1 [Neptuniibacter caesariensis]
MAHKILIIHTGGTIGMQASPEGYIPVSGFETLIRERLAHSHHAALPEFDMLELSPLIDSANLNPEHWNQIAQILQAHYRQYQGFVILHGTDTMAYSASMLSYLMQGLDKPVIFTGSQIPLSELRNDALDNLITALILAAFHPVNEVCVYFNGRLLRGNRSSKVKATGLDAFDSPNYPWLGQIGLHIELHSHLFLASADGPRFSNPGFAANAVAVLPIYPGIGRETAEAVCNIPGIHAVILRSYGVGNLPDSNKDFIETLHSASRHNILLVNSSQCLQADVFQGQYACSSILNQIGVLSAGEMTLEAVYTKLHFLLATCDNMSEVKERFMFAIAGERSGSR